MITARMVDTQRMDAELLGKAWLDMEQVAALPGMKLIYQYWGSWRCW